MRKKNLTKAVETTVAPNPKEVDIWVEPKDDDTVSLKYYDYHDKEWKGGSDENGVNGEITNNILFNTAYLRVYAYDNGSAGAIMPGVSCSIDFNNKTVSYTKWRFDEDLTNTYESHVLQFEEVETTDIMTFEKLHYYKVDVFKTFGYSNTSNLNIQLTAAYRPDLSAEEQPCSYRCYDTHHNGDYLNSRITEGDTMTHFSDSVASLSDITYIRVHLPENTLDLRIY